MTAWLRRAADAANLCPEHRGSQEENQVGWGGSGGPGEGGPAWLRRELAKPTLWLQSQKAHLSSEGCEAGSTAARDEKHVLGSTGKAGTTKDTPPGRQLTRSFIKGSMPGFDYELRSLESAHCGNPELTFPFFFFGCLLFSVM